MTFLYTYIPPILVQSGHSEKWVSNQVGHLVFSKQFSQTKIYDLATCLEIAKIRVLSFFHKASFGNISTVAAHLQINKYNSFFVRSNVSSILFKTQIESLYAPCSWRSHKKLLLVACIERIHSSCKCPGCRKAAEIKLVGTIAISQFNDTLDLALQVEIIESSGQFLLVWQVHREWIRCVPFP